MVPSICAKTSKQTAKCTRARCMKQREPYIHLRGMSHNFTSFSTNDSASQSQKSLMQPSAFSNPFLGIASQEQACMPDGTFLAHDDEQQNVVEKWMHLFRTLIDERGPWSTNPFPDSVVRHWKFDKTEGEGAWRRRLKLRHSYHFDEKLCHPPSTSPSKEATIPINESKSGLGEHIPEQMKQFLLKMMHRITDEPTLVTTENDADLSGQKASVWVDLSESQHPELVKDNSDQFKTEEILLPLHQRHKLKETHPSNQKIVPSNSDDHGSSPTKPETIQWANKTVSTKSVQPKEAHLHQFMDMKMASKDLDIPLLYPINSSGKIW
ncbi:hypothetical protein AAG906_025831 [Vitis piasezkii]